jgi:hypothetical protein
VSTLATDVECARPGSTGSSHSRSPTRGGMARGRPVSSAKYAAILRMKVQLLELLKYIHMRYTGFVLLSASTDELPKTYTSCTRKAEIIGTLSTCSASRMQKGCSRHRRRYLKRALQGMFSQPALMTWNQRGGGGGGVFTESFTREAGGFAE